VAGESADLTYITIDGEGVKLHEYHERIRDSSTGEKQGGIGASASGSCADAEFEIVSC
jgi:hypothetical protein